MKSWPSGLRHNAKSIVLVGVESNPTDVTVTPGYHINLLI